MIFYFSATGNSKYVATRIAAETGDHVISITDCLKMDKFAFSLNPGERIGLVCPTYFCILPTVVEEFLQLITLTAVGKPYVYFVATYGTTTGQVGLRGNQYMKMKGFPMNAQFSVKMPDTWTPIFNLTNKVKLQKINDLAEPQIDEVIKKILNAQEGDFIKNKTPRFIVNLYAPTYEKARKTSHFLVEASCIGCGTCAKGCPVTAIEMQNGKPVWTSDKCVMCLSCLHHCPTFSIQYGNKTKTHGQYINPHV
jgi:ferredoxin